MLSFSSFVEAWNEVFRQINAQFNNSSEKHLKANDVQTINSLINCIEQLIQQAEEINLYQQPLHQILFHLNNLITTTHLAAAYRWQYAEAAVLEASIMSKVVKVEQHKANTLLIAQDNAEPQEKNKKTLSFRKLPPEMRDNVAYYLDQQSLISLMSTNRFFKNDFALKKRNEQFNRQFIKTIGFTFISFIEQTYYLFENGKVLMKAADANTYTEVKLSNHLPIKDMVCGREHLFFIDIDDNLHTAGCYSKGEMGSIPEEISTDKISPDKPIPFSENKRSIKNLIAGNRITYIQDDSGKWLGGGSNEYNQFGQAREPSAIFTPISYEIDKIACGRSHTLFLIKNEWYITGNNRHGKLGILPLGETINTLHLISLPNKEVITEVVAGDSTTFLKSACGQWYACGDNQYGALGIHGEGAKNSYFSPQPVKLPNDRKITNIVCRLSYTFMEDEDSNWYICGDSPFRREQNFLIPTPLCLTTSAKPIRKIIFGYGTNYFLTENGWWQFGQGSSIPKKLNIDLSVFQQEECDKEEIINPSINMP